MAIAAIGEGTGKVCNRFTLSKFNGYSSRRSLSPSAVLLRRRDQNRKLVGRGETGAEVAELTLTNFASFADVSLFRSC
jgi:hypothetical protein